MTDRPIIFSAPMVRALLEGRKSQTRRVLKDGHTPTGLPAKLRPFALGDRLWVREAWRSHRNNDCLSPRALTGKGRVWYEADRDNCDQHGKLRPSLYMPRWASRLTLLVADVRVQRLQDISEADAVAEGLQLRLDWLWQYRGADHLPWRSEFPRDAYRDLWNSLHGPDAWDQNPWVCALTFDAVRANIEEVK